MSPAGQITGTFAWSEQDIDLVKSELHDVSSTTVLPVGDLGVVVDPVRRTKTLYCFGAGHVALATARVAAFAGFRVTVVDDRSGYANAGRFPDAGGILVIKWYSSSPLEGLPIDGDFLIVIVTRGRQHDRIVLEQALRTKAAYIGMIGSRRKRDTIYVTLLSQGVAQKQLDRVHCPIGLAVGAETPEEIAVSIVAELIAERAKVPGDERLTRCRGGAGGRLFPAGGQLQPLLPLGKRRSWIMSSPRFLRTGRCSSGGRLPPDRGPGGRTGRDINIIDNPATSSVCSLRSRPASATWALPVERFFVMPVRYPAGKTGDDCHASSRRSRPPTTSIIYPVFSGRRGHPPLIPSSLIPSLLGWRGEGGLRRTLSGHQRQAIEVAVPDGNILFDVDTPEDYSNLLERFRRSHIPTDAECAVIVNDVAGVAGNIRLHCENSGRGRCQNGPRAE